MPTTWCPRRAGLKPTRAAEDGNKVISFVHNSTTSHYAALSKLPAHKPCPVTACTAGGGALAVDFSRATSQYLFWFVLPQLRNESRCSDKDLAMSCSMRYDLCSDVLEHVPLGTHPGAACGKPPQARLDKFFPGYNCSKTAGGGRITSREQNAVVRRARVKLRALQRLSIPIHDVS